MEIYVCIVYSSSTKSGKIKLTTQRRRIRKHFLLGISWQKDTGMLKSITRLRLYYNKNVLVRILLLWIVVYY